MKKIENIEIEKMKVVYEKLSKVKGLDEIFWDLIKDLKWSNRRLVSEFYNWKTYPHYDQHNAHKPRMYANEIIKKVDDYRELKTGIDIQYKFYGIDNFRKELNYPCEFTVNGHNVTILMI